jgi:hypothetical protein
MNKRLIAEAKQYGISASLYNLLPPRQRESTLKKDRERAKAREEKKGVADGRRT